MQYYDDDPYDEDNNHDDIDTVGAYGSHSMTTPNRPPSAHSKPRYAPYYTPPYMFPDMQSSRYATMEKLLSSVVESQKKEMGPLTAASHSASVF